MDDTQEPSPSAGRAEGQQFEGLSAIPSPHRMAQILTAMANSGGGIVEFDIGPRATEIPLSDLSKLLKSANRFLGSKPHVLVRGLESRNNRSVIVLQVMESQTPITADGVVLVREGDMNRVASAGDLQRFVKGGSSEADLQSQLTSFARVIEVQSQKIESLIASSSWKDKLMWAVIGAVIGALVGIVPTLLLA